MIDHPEALQSCQCYYMHSFDPLFDYYAEFPEIENYENLENTYQTYQTQVDNKVIVDPKDINPSWRSDIEITSGMYSTNNDSYRYQKMTTYEMMDFDQFSDDEESTLSFYSNVIAHDEDPSVDSTFSQVVDMSCEDMTIEESSMEYNTGNLELDYSNFCENGLINPYPPDYYNVILNPSKSPVVEALAFCVVMRIGAYQTPELEKRNQVAVTDLYLFLDGIKHFCTKKNPTEKEEARVKSLKLWFNSIPKRNVRDRPFIMDIKPKKASAIQSKIKKMKKFVAERGLLRVKNV